MSRVIITSWAANRLERCRKFLLEKNPQASKRAAQEIAQHLTILEHNPNIGRPFNDQPDLRELIIRFGSSGYVALYKYDLVKDTVYLLAFTHQNEAGYI